jgi:hypothetical protein
MIRRLLTTREMHRPCLPRLWATASHDTIQSPQSGDPEANQLVQHVFSRWQRDPLISRSSFRDRYSPAGRIEMKVRSFQSLCTEVGGFIRLIMRLKRCLSRQASIIGSRFDEDSPGDGSFGRMDVVCCVSGAPARAIIPANESFAQSVAVSVGNWGSQYHSNSRERANSTVGAAAERRQSWLESRATSAKTTLRPNGTNVKKHSSPACDAISCGIECSYKSHQGKVPGLPSNLEYLPCKVRG